MSAEKIVRRELCKCGHDLTSHHGAEMEGEFCRQCHCDEFAPADSILITREQAIQEIRDIQLSCDGMTELEKAFAHQKKFSKGDANGIAAVLETVQRKLRALGEKRG